MLAFLKCAQSCQIVNQYVLITLCVLLKIIACGLWGDGTGEILIGGTIAGIVALEKTLLRDGRQCGSCPKEHRKTTRQDPSQGFDVLKVILLLLSRNR